MSQSDFGTIDPNTKNGTELASDLNSFRDALHTSHLGSSRPSYVQAGMVWIDDTGAPLWTMKAFDGTDDLTLFTLNIDTNTIGAAFSTIALVDAGTVNSFSATRSGTPPTVNIALIEDQAAANNFSNFEIKAHRPGIIFRDTTSSADDFRIGIDGNALKISIDTDDDDARDSGGHFTDVPGILSLTATAITTIGTFQTTGEAIGVLLNGAGSTAQVQVANTDNSNAASHAKLEASSGGSSGGDPYMHWIVQTAQAYTMGIDNSDSDKFVGSIGSVHGTTNWLEVTSAGAVLLADALSVSAAGKVGIGIAVAAELLHVFGTGGVVAEVESSGSSNVRYRLTNADGGWDLIVSATSGDFKLSQVGGAAEMTASATAITIPTNDFVVTAGDLQVTAGDVTLLEGVLLVTSTASTNVATFSRNVSGVGGTAVVSIVQDHTGGIIPPLALQQDDIDQHFINFATTIGIGNAIEAVGAKTLTPTHFIKVTIPGPATRYIPVGTIA